MNILSKLNKTAMALNSKLQSSAGIDKGTYMTANIGDNEDTILSIPMNETKIKDDIKMYTTHPAPDASVPMTPSGKYGTFTISAGVSPFPARESNRVVGMTTHTTTQVTPFRKTEPTSNERIANLVTELKKLEDESNTNAELRQQIDTIVERAVNAEGALARAQVTTERQAREIRTAEKDVVYLRNELSGAEKLITELREQVKHLESTVDDQDRQIDVLQTRVQTAETKLAVIKSHL